MVQNASMPPDPEDETPAPAVDPSDSAVAPEAAAPVEAERKPVERLVQPQPHEPVDRTERYLRGPTAYCA